MRETAEDLARLQALLDRSLAGAGAFLRSSFEMPEHSLSAPQLARALHGLRTVSLATTTARGAPRVAPVGALFYRARYHIPTTAAAARTRHISQRPAVSLTDFTGNDVAIIAHGQASILAPGAADFDALEAVQLETSGTSVRSWGEGVFLRVEAEAFFTYVREPGSYPA